MPQGRHSGAVAIAAPDKHGVTPGGPRAYPRAMEILILCIVAFVAFIAFGGEAAIQMALALVWAVLLGGALVAIARAVWRQFG